MAAEYSASQDIRHTHIVLFNAKYAFCLKIPRMRNSTNLTIWTAALFVASIGLATAETFRCQVDGKTIYSDIPCAAKNARVDSASDKVSRSQKLQAEIVDQQNRNQLSELQYQAARTRQTPASIYILNSANSPPASTSVRTTRPR